MNEPLNAGDICTRIVTVAQPQASLVEAAQLMRQDHVGCLVVVRETAEGRQVVGILTDRDIVTAAVAQGLDPATLRVEDLMVAPALTVLESESFIDLLRTMRRLGLRRLPVTSAAGMLVGLVTLDDALEILSEQLQTLVRAITAEQRREREQRP